MQFCTQADVERAVGGAKPLAQLLDPNRTGTGVDAQSMTDVLDMGSLEIASYIQVAISLAGLTAPYPRILVLKTADVCAFHAWMRGAQGQGIPEQVVHRYEAAIRWAQDVGARRATIGIDPKPAVDPPNELIDPQQGAIPSGFAGGTNDWEMNATPSGGSISIAGFRRSGFR